MYIFWKSQFNEKSNQIDYMMIYGYSFPQIKSLMEAFYFLTDGNIDLESQPQLLLAQNLWVWKKVEGYISNTFGFEIGGIV